MTVLSFLGSCRLFVQITSSLRLVSVIFSLFVHLVFRMFTFSCEIGCYFRKYRPVVDLIINAYVAGNPIFYGPNKHNPFRGHMVYLCHLLCCYFPCKTKCSVLKLYTLKVK